MFKTAQEVLIAQKQFPVWIVNQTCDNLLEDLVPPVMNHLGLKFGEDGFPLTEIESQFIGEDYIEAPFGGAMTGPAWLFKGKKYIGVDIEICYDSPDRIFDEDSYGDELLPNSHAAWEEALKLVDFLNPKLCVTQGIAEAVEGGPDRHFVAVMIPPEYLIETFTRVPGSRPFKLFKRYIKSLFRDYN